MKIALFVFMLIWHLANPVYVIAQRYAIDSSRKWIDVTGDFNGAEISLPAVKKLPVYPGGKKAWHDFLRASFNIKTPFANGVVPGEYNVMVRFTISHEGKIRGIHAESNCGFGIESEVIRCINKSVDWLPAETARGQKVALTLRTIMLVNVKANDVAISFH